MFILEWTVLQQKRPELAQVKRDPKSPAAVKSTSARTWCQQQQQGLAAGAGVDAD